MHENMPKIIVKAPKSRTSWNFLMAMLLVVICWTKVD